MDEKFININQSNAIKLLDKTPNSTYVQEWTDILSHERGSVHLKAVQSILLFKIGNECLALKTSVVKEVIGMRLIRVIPHLTDGILNGIINLRGQLALCIALEKVLQIDTPSIDNSNNTSKMISIGLNDSNWVFIADEVFGIHLIYEGDITNTPVTVAKSTANYLKGIISIENKTASLLDEELLFYSLEKRLL